MKRAVAFDTALAVRALSNSGADVTPELLHEIEGLLGRNEYGAAAERAANALENGATDVRVVAPFLLGVFLTGGPQSLAPVLEVLRWALCDRWPVIRPEARKARLVDVALSWLFRAIVLHIDFHTKLSDAAVRRWPGADFVTVGQPGLLASSALRTAIEQVTSHARSTVQLSELDARLREYFNRNEVQPSEVQPSEVQPSEVQPSEVQPSEARQSPLTAEWPAVDDEGAEARAQSNHRVLESPDRAGEQEQVLELSPAMLLLLRKLSAFETLTQRGDLARAAIVADDLRGALENFDPRVYFPRLLSPYARAFATHVDDLAPHWEGIGSPSWRALDQLYRLDMDAFLAE